MESCFCEQQLRLMHLNLHLYLKNWKHLHLHLHPNPNPTLTMTVQWTFPSLRKWIRACGMSRPRKHPCKKSFGFTIDPKANEAGLFLGCVLQIPDFFVFKKNRI
jgi:hypothetical protein